MKDDVHRKALVVAALDISFCQHSISGCIMYVIPVQSGDRTVQSV
jgi:hypothetical protein